MQEVTVTRPCVLVFAGADPSGGAGISADILAITAQGAHPLVVLTAVTVQDNDRVFSVYPVDADVVYQQAQALINKIPIAAVKLGIIGNCANAEIIAKIIQQLRAIQVDLPVIVDPVLASGGGDVLSTEDALDVVAPLIPLASIVLPNLPELNRLSKKHTVHEQAAEILKRGCQRVFIKGGHANGDVVHNILFDVHGSRSWDWPRLHGAFHGSGCTLASALAGMLATGMLMEEALAHAQQYCYTSLQYSYKIAVGQTIPLRSK